MINSLEQKAQHIAAYDKYKILPTPHFDGINGINSLNNSQLLNLISICLSEMLQEHKDNFYKEIVDLTRPR